MFWCWGEDLNLTDSVHLLGIFFASSKIRSKGFQVLIHEQNNLLAPMLSHFLRVLGRGLEPPWIAPLAPKASASANFATPALL